MGGQGVRDLGAVDVLPAGDYHVFLAVDDVQEPLVVGPYQIAGVEPAAGEGLLGGGWVVPVARHEGGPAVDDLADLAGRHVVHQLVDDPRGDGRDGRSHRADLADR